jgi:ornithine cyclodeaminase/alanine dehydrogenase-like protein (mu-crystallin family)
VPHLILTDEDVARLISPADAQVAMAQALAAGEAGALVAPPRIAVPAGRGDLVFTVGAETVQVRAAGFRVYGRYPGAGGLGDQVVAVFDSENGELRGLVLGRLLGGLRTAAINALAIQAMSQPDASRLGILGTGFQAWHHVRAALSTQPFARVRVFSPNRAHRDSFARELAGEFDRDIQASESAEEVVRSAQVLICATNAGRPVLESDWIAPGAHINGVGPKFKGRHELPPALADTCAVIATDSVQQVDDLGQSFYLEGRPSRRRLVSLGSLLDRQIRSRLPLVAVTYFCSVGLAGTEVVLADMVLSRALELEDR